MKAFTKKLTVMVTVLLIIVVGSIYFSRVDFESVRLLIASAGLLGPLVYIMLMALAIIISPIPSLPLAMIAGLVFGGLLGGVYTLIGAELGAVTAFLIARRYGRPFLERYFKKSVTICDGCSEAYLVTFIFLSRLLPIFQFDIISYASGLTLIRLWKFALATLLGMAPITFVLTYSGQSVAIGNVWISIASSIILVSMMYFVPKYLQKHNIVKGGEAVSKDT